MLRSELFVMWQRQAMVLCEMQNVDAQPHTSPEEIKTNLIAQLTAPVRWTSAITNMINDGATEFIECGPGNVQQGLIAKIRKSIGEE